MLVTFVLSDEVVVLFWL